MKEKNHISLMIIMISISLFCSYHIYYYFINNEKDNLVQNYYEKPIIESRPLVQQIDSEKEEYLGILKIPKINLVQGFYNINSKNNTINKSVTILKESILPNTNGSIVYLVAHSGTGYLAFFKNLNQLALDDNLFLDIDNNSYQYIISDIYEIDKNGKIIVNHNIHENYLVLSTCSKNNKQLVIISKLIN